MTRPTLLALPVLLAVFTAGSAATAPTTFTDRSAWTAAVGVADLFLEDFEGFGSDTSFSSSPLDVGAFTIEQASGSPLGSSNLIDVSPFISPSQTVNGTSFVRGYVNNDNSPSLQAFILITFEVPVFAWGADFFSPDSDEGLLVVLLNQQIPQTSFSVPGAGGFFGFVDSTDAYEAIALVPRTSTTGGELFGMDDVAGASHVIPEPTPAGLVALGLLALAASRRRRR